jgi:uncharacterized membrane protein YhaH (DUF805 family)
MLPTLGLLFGLKQRVTRKAYLGWGFALAAVKFAIDTAIVYGCTHKVWSPWGYLVPSLVLRQESVGAGPGVMHVLLVLMALPFLWVGLSMSVRRAADAGLSPWIGVAFLVPGLNYLTIALLSLRGSKDNAEWTAPPMAPYRKAAAGDAPPESVQVLPPSMRAAFLGILCSVGIGAAMLGLSVYGLGAYGMALFFATPFSMGAAASWIYNAKHPRGLGSTIGVALLGTVLTGAMCLLFAVEGTICLIMALPIAAGLSVIGAIIAWSIASHTSSTAPRALMLVLPTLALTEAKVAAPTLRDVTTSIEVDAAPERVWPNVIGFSELPAPPEWFFKLGVAYPMRARINGAGVGAVRHCEFSTGPFVEPITVWNPPHHLAFDVTSQPPSMTELSPYQSVKAPHLEGYMVSRGGEFRLTALPGGRTRIDGTTHYTLAIYPESYWVLFAEPLLHSIHGRVLSHIKNLSERQP